jgi:hypothetical protein
MLVKSSQRLIVLVASAVLVASGCSGSDLPETVPVTGNVLYKGEPVANAQVGFVPKDQDSGVRPARGQTDDAGQFKLRTYFGPDHDVAGATPGEYVVTVEKRDVPADPAEMTKMFSKNPSMVPKNLLPGKYATAKSSSLSATVEKGGDNSFELELTD